MSNFWIPPSKRELVALLAARWPEDRARFQRMRKARLYAIYYNYRADEITDWRNGEVHD